jgi:hypothetical protein
METKQTAKDQIKNLMRIEFNKTKELMEFIESHLDNESYDIQNRAVMNGIALVNAIYLMEDEFLKLKKVAGEFEKKFKKDKKNGH